MGLIFRNRIFLGSKVLKKCIWCNKLYSENTKFCPICGKKLIDEKILVYANIGRRGITSFSFKMPNGTTINSKGNLTIPLGKGISYTTRKKNR